MKYLKYFRMITESTDVLSESELISLVDQKLIDDLMDSSLYIIDEGFYLIIYFYADWISIGGVEICHNEKSFITFPLPIGTEINEIEGYSFTFRHKAFNHSGNEVSKEDMVEILDRVKYLNPGVNIKIENNHHQQLTSLEGCPEHIIGSFDCYSNRLISLEGFHRHDFEGDINEPIKIFEGKSERMENIKDICLELTDIGMILDLGANNYIIINAPFESGRYKKYNWSDVKDCVLRLKDYLGNDYIAFWLGEYEHNKGAWREIKLDENTEINGTIISLAIEYRRSGNKN